MRKNIPKRLLAQCFFFLLQNPLLKNVYEGKIYQGNLKMICSPGLNCYSCPAAVTSCPIGALQFFLSGAKHSVSLLVSGFLLTVGVIFGRFICGYVCPMGLLQDLLYKIKTPKLILRLRFLRYLKYAVLSLLVVILPVAAADALSGLGTAWFCKYLCPSGTIFGALPLLAVNEFLQGFAGIQFVLKLVIAVGLMLLAVVLYRFFCRALCPLGAIYSLFNRIALLNMRCDKEKCTSCGHCAKACPIRIDPAAQPNAPECVRCGKCVAACPARALRYGRRGSRANE